LSETRFKPATFRLTAVHLTGKLVIALYEGMLCRGEGGEADEEAPSAQIEVLQEGQENVTKPPVSAFSDAHADVEAGPQNDTASNVVSHVTNFAELGKVGIGA
jgi:hypothetical protein